MTTPTLYAIVAAEQVDKHGVVSSLKAACIRRGMRFEYQILEDIALDSLVDRQFTTGSLLYRVSTSSKAAIIESMLVLLHPDTFTTIYHPKTLALTSRPFRELCEQIAAGLAIVPTTIIDETWQQLDSEQLQTKIAPLGGFPVIIKALGLSHGRGVHKLDTPEALLNLLQNASFEEYNLIARKYLKEYRHYRLIVVDNGVVAAIEYHQPADDFRTNALAEPKVTAVAVADLRPAWIDLAVQGVGLRFAIMGGVDILVDETDGMAYLAEVNVPCYFERAEGPTGIDIASKIIDAMLKRQQEADA